MAGLRFWQGGEPLTNAEVLHLLSAHDPAVRNGAADVLGEVLQQNVRNRAHHQYAGQGQGDRDRWRGFKRRSLAQPFQLPSRRGRRCPDRRRCAAPIPRSRTAITRLKAKCSASSGSTSGIALHRCRRRTDPHSSVAGGAAHRAEAYGPSRMSSPRSAAVLHRSLD